MREKLGGLMVWLKDMKARAALTCCCGMDLFSICLVLFQVYHHSMRGTQMSLSLPHSLFWIGVCTSLEYVHSYLCVCVFVWGLDVCPVFALPTLEQCPAVPAIPALILMLLGRKSGTAGSCRVVINLELISALPNA